MNNNMRENIKNYIYYILVGVASFVTLVFLPMIGTEIPDIKVVFPKTELEWAIFLVVRLMVSILNVVIFHSFIKQGKINIKDNGFYKAANEILLKNKDKKYKPRSPKRFLGGEYSRKGITLFISTLGSTVVLTSAILTYDWIALLSYILVIIMAIIFGVLEMKKVEEYWTTEYYDFAKMIEYKQKHEEPVTEPENKEVESC